MPWLWRAKEGIWITVELLKEVHISMNYVSLLMFIPPLFLQ